jgi:hypothetical protein
VDTDGAIGDIRRSALESAALLLLRGLLFRSGLSVTSDVVEMVPTGGELTLFEAVGLAGLTSCCCVARRRSGMSGVT